jgi:hypothetical protein
LSLRREKRDDVISKRRNIASPQEQWVLLYFYI